MASYIRWEGKARETGTRTQVVDTTHADSEFDAEPGNRWMVICMDHSMLVTSHNLETALTLSAHPLQWCGRCNGSDTEGGQEAPAKETYFVHDRKGAGELANFSAINQRYSVVRTSDNATVDTFSSKKAAQMAVAEWNKDDSELQTPAEVEEAAELTTKTVQVAVWGPNLGTSHGSEAMHIHSVGCADTRKGVYKGHTPWKIEVSSLQEIVEDVYGDMLDESEDSDWHDYAGDIRLFPCTGIEA